MTERDRSYAVRRDLPIGRTATLRRDVPWGPITYFAGTVVIVRDYMNAGFRGIDASVEVAPGTRIMISAGILDAIEGNPA